LILTVEQLAGVYREGLLSPAKKTADIGDLLSSCILVTAYKNGEQLFDKAVSSLHTILSKHVKSQFALTKRLQILESDITAYNMLPKFKSFGPPDNSQLKVKADLFRYPTLLADHIRMLMGMSENKPWAVYKNLAAKQVLTNDQLLKLNAISALVIYIRTHACLQLKSQHDYLSLYPPKSTRKFSRYHISHDVFILLSFLFIPVKLAVEENLAQIKKGKQM